MWCGSSGDASIEVPDKDSISGAELQTVLRTMRASMEDSLNCDLEAERKNWTSEVRAVRGDLESQRASISDAISNRESKVWDAAAREKLEWMNGMAAMHADITKLWAEMSRHGDAQGAHAQHLEMELARQHAKHEELHASLEESRAKMESQVQSLQRAWEATEHGLRGGADGAAARSEHALKAELAVHRQDCYNLVATQTGGLRQELQRLGDKVRGMAALAEADERSPPSSPARLQAASDNRVDECLMRLSELAREIALERVERTALESVVEGQTERLALEAKGARCDIDRLGQRLAAVAEAQASGPAEEKPGTPGPLDSSDGDKDRERIQALERRLNEYLDQVPGRLDDLEGAVADWVARAHQDGLDELRSQVTARLSDLDAKLTELRPGAESPTNTRLERIEDHARRMEDNARWSELSTFIGQARDAWALACIHSEKITQLEVACSNSENAEVVHQYAKFADMEERLYKERASMRAASEQQHNRLKAECDGAFSMLREEVAKGQADLQQRLSAAAGQDSPSRQQGLATLERDFDDKLSRLEATCQEGLASVGRECDTKFSKLQAVCWEGHAKLARECDAKLYKMQLACQEGHGSVGRDCDAKLAKLQVAMVAFQEEVHSSLGREVDAKLDAELSKLQATCQEGHASVGQECDAKLSKLQVALRACQDGHSSVGREYDARCDAKISKLQAVFNQHQLAIEHDCQEAVNMCGDTAKQALAVANKVQDLSDEVAARRRKAEAAERDMSAALALERQARERQVEAARLQFQMTVSQLRSQLQIPESPSKPESTLQAREVRSTPLPERVAHEATTPTGSTLSQPGSIRSLKFDLA